MVGVDNVIVGGGTDVITLSLFNRPERFDEHAYIPKVQPGEKLPPFFAPIEEQVEGEPPKIIQ